MTSGRLLLVGKGPPDRGGIAATLSTLGERLPGDVDLLNLTRPATYVAGRLSVGNVRRTVADALELWRRAEAGDVVDIHTAFVPAVTMVRASLLAAVARMRRASVLIHVHGGGLPAWLDRSWRRRLARLALRPAHAVVAVSADIAAALRSTHDRVALIPNGVDTARFRPGAEQRSSPVVLYVGLLADRKGVIDLMEASHRLRTNGIDHRLVLVGGRPDEGDEAESVVRNAATGGEEFVGAVDHGDMPDWYRAADIFCLPSWFEAMPLSILEAMASGLPVVATNVGEIPQMVDDDVGRLVAPRDVEGLSAALAELLENPALRAALGERARRRAVERYSIDGTVRATAEVYAQVSALAD